MCGGVLALILVLSGALRWRLASMPLERDEGEYAYMAQLLIDGVPPYSEAYGMKFPGIYIAYAIILSVFGETDTAIRAGLIVVNSLSTILIFLLGRVIGGTSTGLWAAAGYSVISLAPALQGITANAEHFILLPALGGALLVLCRPGLQGSFLGGVSFGLALSVKQQGFAFAIFGMLWVVWRAMTAVEATMAWSVKWKRAGLSVGVHAGGIALPGLLLCFWLWITDAYPNFRFWCFDYAAHYGSMWTWRDGLIHFWTGFGAFFRDHWPVLIAAGAGFVAMGRNDRHGGVFAGTFLLAGLFATMPGLVFRPHYFLLLAPGLALATGVGLAALGRFSMIGLLAIGFPLAMQFRLLCLDDPESACRRLYPHNAFVETRQVGRWLRESTPAGHRVAILGSEPQVFFYANRRSATPYLYMYPMLEPQPFARGLQQHLMDILQKSPPPHIVHVPVPTSWLVYPDSETALLEWMLGFLREQYVQEHVVQIPDVVQVSDQPKVAPGREIAVYRLK